MTVAELIEELRRFPAHHVVLVDFASIESIRESRVCGISHQVIPAVNLSPQYEKRDDF